VSIGEREINRRQPDRIIRCREIEQLRAEAARIRPNGISISGSGTPPAERSACPLQMAGRRVISLGMKRFYRD
jgi:hypothetical protein